MFDSDRNSLHVCSLDKLTKISKYALHRALTVKNISNDPLPITHYRLKITHYLLKITKRSNQIILRVYE